MNPNEQQNLVETLKRLLAINEKLRKQLAATVSDLDALIARNAKMLKKRPRHDSDKDQYEDR